jgi:hypothetical protein
LPIHGAQITSGTSSVSSHSVTVIDRIGVWGMMVALMTRANRSVTVSSEFSGGPIVSRC